MATAEYIDIDHDMVDAAEVELAERHLKDFAIQAWHVVEPVTPLKWEPHLDAYCEHIEAWDRGEILNLLITSPPGTTKSIFVSVMYPAFAWIGNPNERFLTASNEADVATRDAVASRRLIQSQWYRERWGHVYELTGDQNLKGWYENNRRGYRTVTTVGSKVTGKKGGKLILDDPHDAMKVHSEAERDAVKSWWKNAFYNRVNDPKTSGRLVIGQRTHLEDLQSELIKGGEFVHLDLPEEFEPSRRSVTSIGWSDWRTEPGELLRPERFGQAQIDEAKATLGQAGYEAQHQQNPIEIEGAEFPAEWFGDSIWFDEWPRQWVCRVMAVDPSKGKESKAGDFSAIPWGVVDHQGTVWVDATVERINTKELAEQIVEQVKQFPVDAMAVEVNQFQELLADQIETVGESKNVFIPIIPIENRVNKNVRIRRLTPYLGRGKIRFKANSRGTQRMVDQLRQFPLGDHDDGPDGLEMMIRIAGQLISEPVDDGLGGSVL